MRSWVVDVGGRALAVLIVLAGAWLLLEFVVGLVTAAAWTVAAVLAVVALVWAVRTL